MTLIDPTPADLAVASLLYGAVVGLSLKEGLGVEKSLTVAALRMGVQLFFVGYLVRFLFGVERWYVVTGALFLMSLYAARAGVARMKRPVPGLWGPMWIGVFGGTLFTTAVVTQGVLKLDPWYAPEGLIPLGGMILGNAMNGGALAADRLHAELKARRDEIEALLALGLTYPRAAREASREAVRGALIPTVNSMLTVGIVHLPGIMVGQMLGGADPVTAAKYQFVIMLMVAASVSLTAALFVKRGLAVYFTGAHQLRHELFGEK
ncbi:MAG: iron export ABC transporter permease subunit FetB [Nitrospinae bacterium]|nr:iron export ABC transporter permease subunit FetB [Nitrospinota bacterium]